MPAFDNLPDLSHWKTIQEFTIEQAALLLAGIDPYDYDDGLQAVRSGRHERWKLAWGLSEGIVSAIRRGVLTPVVCMGEEEKWNDWENAYFTHYEPIKTTDRTKEISKRKTIITRDSLFSWVEAERVDYAKKPKKETVILHQHAYSPNTRTIIDVEPEARKQSVPMLPLYEHKSEGLELVEEAIKQFWSTYDENDPATAPTKQEVMTYLKEKSVSNNLAEAVDMVLRPFSVRGVGRRKQTKTNG
ncbi:hypothetical protein [Dickeya dadantii]|nr:hypothetical protein [Dickeya dadantii]